MATGKRRARPVKTTARQAYGLTVLKAADRRVRRLKRQHEPSIHGNKFWSSSWVLMDYLAQQGLPPGCSVMELGCGWGLAGIFCARHFSARVTGVDADPEVFPYLELHAEINGVEIDTHPGRFEDLSSSQLAAQRVLIGADICFWDEMTEPLYGLIGRALEAGVEQILVADPGRPPFNDMSERCARAFGAEVKEWAVEGAVQASAYLLVVGSLPATGAGRHGGDGHE